jgi:hypothetical protein
MHLKTTNVGALLVSSLEVYLSGTSLLVLSTSLPRRLSGLSELATYMVLVSSIEPIHSHNVVSIHVCISCFTKCEVL